MHSHVYFFIRLSMFDIDSIEQFSWPSVAVKDPRGEIIYGVLRL